MARRSSRRSDVKRANTPTEGRGFAAWVGLVPRQFSTGGRMILGRISKRGNGYLRMPLVQAANVILMRPHAWDQVNSCEVSWAVSPHKKAAVALANKLGHTAWSVLRHGSTYTFPMRRGFGRHLKRLKSQRSSRRRKTWNGDPTPPWSESLNDRNRSRL